MAIASLPGSMELWLLAIFLIYWGVIINTLISVFKGSDPELLPHLFLNFNDPDSPTYRNRNSIM